MKFPFKSDYGLIFVEARLQGIEKDVALILALDKGATGTVISAKRLDEAGYDLDNFDNEIYITTGSGVITVPKIGIEKKTKTINPVRKNKFRFIIKKKSPVFQKRRPESFCPVVILRS